MSVSKQIIEVLNDLCNKFGLAIDWSNKNVMPYLKELMGRFIAWEISTSIIWIVLGVIMSIIGIILVRDIWKQQDDYDYFGDLDEGITWFFIGSLILIIIGILVTVIQCFDICQAIYLPEKTIYDFIQHQICSHN